MTRLSAYGLSEHWSTLFAELDRPTESLGRVVRQDRGFTLVATETRTDLYAVRIEHTGRVVVGDWVTVDTERVTHVFPRRSSLNRRDAHNDVDHLLVSNIDIVLIVCGADRPRKTGRIERSITQALETKAEAIVVLTKIDLLEDSARELKDLQEALPNADVLGVSSLHNDGLDTLRERIADKTSVVLGESGAGKSTLLNALIGDDVSITGEVREQDGKGKHTTTRREMYVLNTGGVFIDTPGVRALGLWADADSVDATFPDIAEVADGCRFADCAHDTEPGCAITAGLRDGTLSRQRVSSWLELREEAAQNELRREEQEKRKSQRARPRK